MCIKLRACKRVGNSFCTKSAMDLLLCCSEAISDFVKGAETHKVLGFVGAEGARPDAKGVEEFMTIPLLQNTHKFWLCLQRFVAACVR